MIKESENIYCDKINEIQLEKQESQYLIYEENVTEDKK